MRTRMATTFVAACTVVAGAAVLALPAGAVTPQGARIAAGPVAAGRGFALRFSARRAAAGPELTLLGRVRAVSGQRPVFRLRIEDDGGIAWWDGAGWTPISAAGTVPADEWVRLGVFVPAGKEYAAVAVNGAVLGQLGPVGVRVVRAVDGYRFTAPDAGARVDRVRTGTGPPPTPGRPVQTGIGEVNVVARSARPAQMPDAATTVPGPRGERIRVSYPVHGDDSSGAGNRYAYSDDGGRTWVDDQAHNPMPDAPSVNLTRLDDGRLLATNYHTYLRGDRHLAGVESAVSTDNGASWTRHTGSLRTPRPMRPISKQTDRPGTALGGFVLVHPAIEQGDGVLLQSAYGYYADDDTYRQLLLRSTDGGAHWTVHATVAAHGPGEGYCEGAFGRAADGALLAFMRTGSYRPLVYARSTDGGRSWSRPRTLRSGPDGLPVPSIYPSVQQLPGGGLALLAGRPGLRVLTSPDGYRWGGQLPVDYRDSGNGAMVRTVRGLLVFGDRGANWSSPTPDPYAVWARTVDTP